MKFPARLYNWQGTHLSIARFGGVILEGVRYTVDITDPKMPLIRDGTPTHEQERNCDKYAKDKADMARAIKAQGVLI